MPKFVIVREVPGAGTLSKGDLQGIATRSCAVLHEMGTRIQWQQSYVTDDQIVCVYIADDEATIREHAAKGGFPANLVTRVHAVIDPTTAE